MTRPPNPDRAIPPIAEPPLGGWTVPRAAARTLRRVAASRAPILCLRCHGPAFARIAAAIHDESDRRALVMIDLRVARGDRASLVLQSAAASATLAIDGIERLDRDAQVALVRLVEARSLRLVSGSTLELEALRERSEAEFFALVSTVAVRVPALAELGEEIGPLAERRLAVLAHDIGRPSPGLSARAIAALAAHSWPGDAIELDALLVRTLLARDADPLDAHDLCWNPEATGDDAAFATDAPASDRATPVVPSETNDGAPPPVASSEAEPDRSTSSAADTAAQRSDAVDLDAPPPWNGLGLPSEALALELAHQIKNPLVVVQAFVRSIADLGSIPAELSSLHEQSDEALRRMDGAIEELLAFARLGAPRPTAIDVVEVLRDSLRDAWPSFASKDVAVEGPNGASLRVVGDEHHLRQALATLARHLLESIEPRGTLAIAIDARGEIRLRYRECGASTHLRGVAGLDPQSLPLPVLLVRGALAPGGGSLEVSHSHGFVEVALRFATG